MREERVKYETKGSKREKYDCAKYKFCEKRGRSLCLLITNIWQITNTTMSICIWFLLKLYICVLKAFIFFLYKIYPYSILTYYL